MWTNVLSAVLCSKILAGLLTDVTTQWLDSVSQVTFSRQSWKKMSSCCNVRRQGPSSTWRCKVRHQAGAFKAIKTFNNFSTMNIVFLIRNGFDQWTWNLLLKTKIRLEMIPGPTGFDLESRLESVAVPYRENIRVKFRSCPFGNLDRCATKEHRHHATRNAAGGIETGQ